MNIAPFLDQYINNLNNHIEYIDNFNRDRFLYAILKKNYTTIDIERKSNEIETYINRLKIVYTELKEVSKTYNKEYATDNNDRFKTAYDILKRMKSRIKEIEKIFKSFCNKKKKKEIFNELLNHIERTYESRSYLCLNPYEPSLFGFEVYSKEVQALFIEMLNYFTLIKTCCKLCINTINEEKEVKADGERCLQLFEKFYVETLQIISNILSRFPTDDIYSFKNPAIESFEQCNDSESWKRNNFHNFKKEECELLVVKLELQKLRNLTKDEIYLFGNDEGKILRYRKLIQAFDKLVPENNKKKPLPPLHVLMLLEYMRCNNFKKGVKYINSIYIQLDNRRFDAAEYGTVMSKRKFFQTDSTEYKKFVEKVKAIEESLTSGQNHLKINQINNLELLKPTNNYVCTSL